MSKGIHAIPDDVIILVMYFLEVWDLASLACTCKNFHYLVEEYGWSICLRLNPRMSHSLQKSLKLWSTKEQLRYHTITDNHWHCEEFIARPFPVQWTTKFQPTLVINSTRLLLAAGNTIYSYIFASSHSPNHAPRVHLECTYLTSNMVHPQLDITSLVCVPDGGMDRTVYVGYASGVLERLVLPPPNDGHDPSIPIQVIVEKSYDFHTNDLIENISISSSHLLSLSASGNVVYLPLEHSQTPPQLLQLNSRCWSSYLSTRSSSPYAAFCSSSMGPLAIHEVSSSGLSHDPSAFLQSCSGGFKYSAVYAIDGAPIGSPWGSSDQILISGWYDGFINVHDLRTPSRTDHSDPLQKPAHDPVLSLADPWSFEPIYSISSGGGSGSYVVAGSARHSVVAFFDVRAPTKGWSVHAPGNDSSPVYSVIVDGPRVFGATQSRGFVFDFGPGVQEDTYPPVELVHNSRNGGRRQRPRPAAQDQFKRSPKNPVGFYVTKYGHSQGKGW
ncbi:hypothetical protein QCA50_015312 [Cerrena zonata]|uniref:F-box domain-containing protein n=1 Tax=Cerrena zonata TaxID=2478898 RepID=A0AAW0FTK4_9APHY